MHVRVTCLQDLAQGAASQQKLIDGAAAVQSKAEHSKLAERQLESLPAKLKQIQGSTESGADANADSRAAADAVGEAADVDEEAEESDEDEELGSISSGEDSEESDGEDNDIEEEEEEEDADVEAAGDAAPAERSSAGALQDQVEPDSTGKPLLSCCCLRSACCVACGQSPPHTQAKVTCALSELQLQECYGYSIQVMFRAVLLEAPRLAARTVRTGWALDAPFWAPLHMPCRTVLLSVLPYPLGALPAVTLWTHKPARILSNTLLCP